MCLSLSLSPSLSAQVPQGLSLKEFDTKFETLLVFLVEAIGVPVMLSLLLLAYSSNSEDVLDLDGLPTDRLQARDPLGPTPPKWDAHGRFHGTP